MPLVQWWTRTGAIVGIAIGGIAGLILGLAANPATAWFAVFEVGIPGGIAGALMGCLGAVIVAVTRRISHSGMPSP